MSETSCHRIHSGRHGGREIVVGVSGPRGASCPSFRRGRAVGEGPRASSPGFIRTASLEVARGELDSGILTARDWVSGLKARARRRRPHPDPRQRRSRRLDRLRVLSRFRDDRDPVQRRHARRDRQRNLAGPPAARGRRDAEGAPAARPLASASLPTRSSTSRTCDARRSPGRSIAPPSPAFYIAEPSVERFLDAYCRRVAQTARSRSSRTELPVEGSSPGRDRRTAGARRRR